MVSDVVALGLKPSENEKEKMRVFDSFKRFKRPNHGVLCPEQDVHCPGGSRLERSVVGDFVGSTIGRLKTIVHIGPTVQVVCLKRA